MHCFPLATFFNRLLSLNYGILARCQMSKNNLKRLCGMVASLHLFSITFWWSAVPFNHFHDDSWTNLPDIRQMCQLVTRCFQLQSPPETSILRLPGSNVTSSHDNRSVLSGVWGVKSLPFVVWQIRFTCAKITRKKLIRSITAGLVNTQHHLDSIVHPPSNVVWRTAKAFAVHIQPNFFSSLRIRSPMSQHHTIQFTW